MSIQEILIFFKHHIRNESTLHVIIIICVGFAGFLLGRASAPASTENTIHKRELSAVVHIDETSEGVIMSSEQKIPSQMPIEGGYVASKNGTKYHLPWCSGAKRIKEENMVWFKTKEEAETSGYTPAANCEGI